MNKVFIGALVALFAFSCTQNTESVAYKTVEPQISLLLYPEGQNVDKGIVENGVAVTLGPGESNELTGDAVANEDGNIGNINDGARIDIYLPAKEKANGQMVVVCPGGGYSFCSGFNEGTRVADWLVKQGIAACVVLYRMPNHHNIVPLTDIQNAFRYCRAHAQEWSVEQIGVMGFSAGGHLAASVSTLYVDEITRPDFSILIYPVISFDPKITHSGTRAELLPEDQPKELEEYYSLEKRVTSDTPKTILLLSADDKTVDPLNSILYYKSLLACGVPSELHIFTKGGHGYGFTTVENYGHDNLGDARVDFFSNLKRWLLLVR